MCINKLNSPAVILLVNLRKMRLYSRDIPWYSVILTKIYFNHYKITPWYCPYYETKAGLGYQFIVGAANKILKKREKRRRRGGRRKRKKKKKIEIGSQWPTYLSDLLSVLQFMPPTVRYMRERFRIFQKVLMVKVPYLMVKLFDHILILNIKVTILLYLASTQL
jgi:hypothetical protein